MNSPAKAHEPTMEEILASIRRIISDDDTIRPLKAPPAAPAASEAAERQSAPEAPAPVLVAPAQRAAADDVDEMFAAIDAQTGLKQQPRADMTAQARTTEELAADLDNDLEVLELTDEVEAPAPVPPRVPAPQAPAPAAPQRLAEKPLEAAESRLVSAKTDETVSQAFGSLAHTVLAGNARTLDDIVREMLRPMLKTWLDDNLPPLVERLVRQEIERVARGGR